MLTLVVRDNYCVELGIVNSVKDGPERGDAQRQQKQPRRSTQPPC
jgi:hypothetical protein